MRVLVTSFEPFGDDSENASSGAMRELLHRWDEPRIELVGVELPVIFDDAPFRRAVAEHAPDVVVALGEAGGRRAITPELLAVNEQRARIPDNAGATPDGEPAVVGAEPERRVSMDVEPFVSAMRDEGWAAQTSDDAGRFVCNFIAFHAYGLDVPAVFIHVPAVRSEGVATVGAETGGAIVGSSGREPRTVADIADALAAAIRRLRPSNPPSAPATKA
jgi:pyroglutamyl-peptidase